MIDALEAGADTLVMTMGLCRLGYYGELQEQIIRDLGYNFEMINLAEYTTGKNRDYLNISMRLRQNTTEIAVLNSTKVTIRKRWTDFIWR